MKIQLKRSNVLESGFAKQPTAGQMEFGELAVNYNENDPAIFIKDSNNQIIRIAGAGYDYNDLDNIPTIGDGTITISSNGETVGSFTVNQEGDTEIELPDSGKLNPPSPGEPGGTPENGDLWIDTSECPPVLKIWSDCEGAGEWYELSGGTPKPIEPAPGDGNNDITPTPPGSGTDGDPYVLTAKVVNYGGTTTSAETISFSNQKPGAFVQFVDQNEGANGSRFSQPLGVIGEDGTWTGQLKFADSPATTDDTTYTGLLKIGSSSIYYSWDVTSETAVIPPPVITQNPVISSSTGETTTPITVDTRAAVTNATFTSSAWLKDGVIISGETSTTSYTPTAAGTYKFREVFTGDDGSTVNADSNELEITVDQTKPSAKMYGLRFDSARSTKLTRSGSGTGTISYWKKDSSTSWTWQHEHQTGAAYPAEIGAGYDGYMSDYYFVDGEALEPETFGKSFEGKWGPLDSAVVLENIKGKTKSPYEERPNMDAQWSSATYWNDTNGFGGSVATIFDGDPTTNRSPNDGQTLIFSPTQFASASSVTITFQGDTVNTPPPKINGNDVPYSAPQTKLVETVDVSGDGFNQLSFQRVGGGPGAINIISIAVDGMELVDGPADNSQNWSDNVDYGADGGLSSGPGVLFDGKLNTSSNAANPTPVTFDFSDNPPQGDIRFYLTAGSSDGGTPYFKVNGVDSEIGFSGAAGWVSPGNIGPGGGRPTQLESFSYNNGGGGTSYVAIAAVEVGGKILIDSGAQWDTSQVWSDYSTAGDNPDWIFNGNITNISSNSLLSADEEVVLDGVSIAGQTLSFVHSTIHANDFTVTFDDLSTTDLSLSVGGGLRTDSYDLGSVKTITKITFDCNGAQSFGLNGVKVNGKVLVDAGSMGSNGFYLPFSDADDLGADYSGQDNDFQAKNFAVGNTSQVWSKGIDVSGVSTAYNSPLNMFDGSTSTEYTVVSGTAVWTPSNPIGTNKVRFYGNYVAPSQSVKFNWAGGSYTHTQVVNNTWADVTSSVQFPITSIEFAAGSNGVTVAALEFDSVVLVDGNIADTVLDTPMKNYAVLESGTNGNLVGSGDLTYSGEAGTTYYYETDGSAVTGTAPISGLPSGAHNFGQQPFQGVGPQGNEQLLFQTWEQYARTALGYALDRIAKLEQLRLVDAATIEDLRTQIAGALSRIASIESDEVNDDAVDNSLITLVGSLSTQVTAFTDRIAQAEAAITDYEGRITTLES